MVVGAALGALAVGAPRDLILAIVGSFLALIALIMFGWISITEGLMTAVGIAMIVTGLIGVIFNPSPGLFIVLALGLVIAGIGHFSDGLTIADTGFANLHPATAAAEVSP